MSNETPKLDRLARQIIASRFQRVMQGIADEARLWDRQRRYKHIRDRLNQQNIGIKRAGIALSIECRCDYDPREDRDKCSCEPMDIELGSAEEISGDITGFCCIVSDIED